jgi:hypothetical protein
MMIHAWAQDYTLFQAENDHFQDYTFEELIQRMGENSVYLPHYRCDGRKEFDLFTPPPRQNIQANSLRLKLPDQDLVLVYRQGRFYSPSGKRVRWIENTFFHDVKLALKKIESFPEGEKLLRMLERSHFPLTIVRGGNAFNPKEENGPSYRGIYMANALSIFSHGRMTSEAVPFHNIGVGGHIGWNPKTTGLPPHVALAHEMMHALDSIRGTLDMRFVMGPNYEMALVSEYRAVYIENKAREAAGFSLRTHYGTETNGPGMLDQNGRPRVLPSPCLKIGVIP